MKRFKDYTAQYCTLPAPIASDYLKFECHNGNSLVKTVDDKAEAEAFKKQADSHWVLPQGEEAFAAASATFVQQEAEALNAWLADLKVELNPDLPDSIYDLCYNQAYEDGHAAGMDEVASYLRDHLASAKTIFDAGFQAGVASK